jgi:hypothetical protein
VNKLVEIGWLRCGEGFEGERGDFKCDALPDRKPMKGGECWRDVVTAFVVR